MTNSNINIFSEVALSIQGILLKQINNILGSSGFSVTITPTAGGVYTYFVIYSIHWVIDTGLASGGSNVSAQMNYYYNGSLRINWTSIFSEFIDNFMDDDSFFFPINGTNNIQFSLSLGALNIANGYFLFKGIYS